MACREAMFENALAENRDRLLEKAKSAEYPLYGEISALDGDRVSPDGSPSVLPPPPAEPFPEPSFGVDDLISDHQVEGSGAIADAWAEIETHPEIECLGSHEKSDEHSPRAIEPKELSIRRVKRKVIDSIRPFKEEVQKTRDDLKKNRPVMEKAYDILRKNYDESRAAFLKSLKGKQSGPDVVVSPLGTTPTISVFLTEAGGPSFDLYNASILPEDSIMLAKTGLCRLEELAAHHAQVLISIIRSIVMKGNQFQVQVNTNDEMARLYEALKKTGSKREKEMAEMRAQLESAHKEIDDKRKECCDLKVQMKVAADKYEKNLELKFQAGRSKGVDDYLVSTEFIEQQLKFKDECLAQFKASKEFQNILNSRAADAVAYGFEKCKRMAIDKDALKSDFDSARLNLFDRIPTISRQTSSITSARTSSALDPSGSNAERDNPDSRVGPVYP